MPPTITVSAVAFENGETAIVQSYQPWLPGELLGRNKVEGMATVAQVDPLLVVRNRERLPDCRISPCGPAMSTKTRSGCVTDAASAQRPMLSPRGKPVV